MAASLKGKGLEVARATLEILKSGGRQTASEKEDTFFQSYSCFDRCLGRLSAESYVRNFTSRGSVGLLRVKVILEVVKLLQTEGLVGEVEDSSNSLQLSSGRT